jgi:hypothetical protein
VPVAEARRLPRPSAEVRHGYFRVARPPDGSLLRTPQNRRLQSFGPIRPCACQSIGRSALRLEQGAEMFPRPFPLGTSADHKFLLLVELDLDPSSRAFPGLVSGIAAFTDQTLKSEYPGFFQKLFNVFAAAGALLLNLIVAISILASLLFQWILSATHGHATCPFLRLCRLSA